MRASVVVTSGLSSCGLRDLECRLSSCGAWALLLHGMWDLPGPGLKPMSPALAGGFLTTAPPGKSYFCFYFHFCRRWVKKDLAVIYVIECSASVFLCFIVSDLTFRSLIHFEFIFVYGIRECSNFILLHVAVQFSQHHLLKRLSFLHCIFLSPFSKIR